MPDSDVVQLNLISHAPTEALLAGRFPVNESLTTTGALKLAKFIAPQSDRWFTAPEARTQQTASALGLVGITEPALRDIDYADWAGLDMSSVPPEGLATWLIDPQQAPHHGESIADLSRRVSDWMHNLCTTPGRVVAVTHPAVVRAVVLTVLRSPLDAFWRMDIGPATYTTVHTRVTREGGSEVWTVRTVGAALTQRL